MPMYRSKSGPSDKIAYTARPDLWPPGAYCWLVGRHLPGAAEAAILAGQVEVTWSNLEWGAE